MIDSFVDQFFRILWYTILFIFWVIKAIFVAIANMSNMGNRRRY